MMGESSLQDRLRDHAKAFDGLLSLIPAKMYYGEDTTDQWQKKKQTKQEANAARRGKLDPDSELNRNAKEVMDERAKNKRKLREMQQESEEQDRDEIEDGEGDSFAAMDDVEQEKPGEGLKKQAAAEEPNKKQKVDKEDEDNQEEEGESSTTNLSKKQQKKAEKKEKAKEKAKEKKAEKLASAAGAATTDAVNDKTEKVISKPKEKKSKKEKKNQDVTPAPSLEATSNQKEGQSEPKTKNDGLVASLDFSALQDAEEANDSSVPESAPQSPTFDTNIPDASEPNASAEVASTTTSSVSSAATTSEKPKHVKIPADSPQLRARLAAKIEALRAARKADGPDGKPIRTRQELIESRRFKQAQRKEHKKELRRLAKLEEERKREEALASNSPGVMSPAVDLDESSPNFSFGRVAFGDGAQLSRDLSYVLNRDKKKGPSDAKTALLKVQNQKKQLEEMDDDKRKDITEKDAWLNARRRAEGERVRDDETMLKKAVKRKETAKKKSEKQWKERAKGVGQAQKERQKKREENIRKRRDEKLLGKAGKKKKGGAGGGGGAKKKGRPGFEGSLGMGRKKK